MFYEIHSNEGVYVQPIVLLNWFYPLIFTHSKLPSYVCDDSTHHYLSLTVRSITYIGNIIKQVETSIHRVVK
jgi:hypothetical protein